MPNFSQFLETARELALQGSHELLTLLKEPKIHRKKEDNSLVTEADLRLNEIFVSGLHKAFPTHAILTEETGLSGNAHSDYVWVIDPIDGTKAYAKGIPGFCAMIGLLYRQEPVLGVVVDPLERRVFEAVKGEGAFEIFEETRAALRVSSRSILEEMPLIISRGFPEKELEKVRRNLPGPLVPPINSVGIKIGLLVRQIGDIYLNHHSINLWDTCAPQVILEEAGGQITQWDGSKLVYTLEAPYDHRARTVASNRAIHDQILNRLSFI